MGRINIGIKIFNFLIFFLIIIVFLVFPIIKLINLPKAFLSIPATQNVSVDNSLFERLDKAIENYLK